MEFRGNRDNACMCVQACTLSEEKGVRSSFFILGRHYVVSKTKKPKNSCLSTLFRNSIVNTIKISQMFKVVPAFRQLHVIKLKSFI